MSEITVVEVGVPGPQGPAGSVIPTYARITGDNNGFGTAAFSVAMPTANQHYPIASPVLTGSISNNAMAGTGSILVQQSGTYVLSYTLSVFPSVADHFHIHAHRNGQNMIETELENQFANANDVQNVGKSTIVNLNAGDYLDLYVHTDSNNRTLNIAHYNFHIQKL